MPTSLDPLSAPTLATKRNLLVVSVLAITYKAFNVSIDAIPLGGLSIKFDNRVFVFLLVVSLLYLLSTFILYYIIDIKNIEASNHEATTAQFYTENLDDRADSIMREIAQSLSMLNLDYKIKLKDDFDSYFRSLSLKNASNYGKSPPILQVFLQKSNSDFLLEHPADIERRDKQRQIASMFLRKEIRRHLKEYRRLKIRASLRLNSIRSIYFIRNYGTDGALPVALGLIALCCLYEVIDLDWLRHIAPPR